MTRIDLAHLSKTYQPRQPPAVVDLSLQIVSQQLLALLGPSGSGKSTVLKLIAGIEPPDQGYIQFDGQPIDRLPAHRRGAVLMFQKAYLFPFLNVAENIAFGLRAQKRSRSAIDGAVARMLELVGLPDATRRRPDQLSGGEQQRIALARALVVEPRVLLLDEPFSSLDPEVRQNLQEAVRAIQRELAITTVLVTHDRAEALAMADQIAILDRGNLIAHASPADLYRHPPTRRAARLMGVESFIAGRVRNGRLESTYGCLHLATGEPDAAAATFAIRSEDLRLVVPPAPNTIEALVCGQTFRGDSYDLHLQIGDLALRMRTLGTPVPPIGTTISVQLPAERLFRVEEDD